jgi:FtsP/CotA-like multicopper oxidase with cupredoxin domain
MTEIHDTPQTAAIDPEAAPTSRRRFLRLSAMGLAATAAAAACKPQNTQNAAGAGAKSADGNRSASNAARPGAMPADSDHSGGSTAPHPAPTARAKADEMDAMHEKGIKSFPAKTEGKGNQPMAPKMVGGVKVFELTAEKIRWEVEPGRTVDAMAYNRQVPGPQIRVREGDRVRVVVHNKLEQSTAVHFHGVEVPTTRTASPTSRSRR